MSPTKAWLLITGHGAWDRLQEAGAWRFAEKSRKRAERVKDGDLAIVYLTQDGGDCGLGGVVRFRGELLEDSVEQTIFGQMYPLRRAFDVVHKPVAPREFRSLIGDLEFITNKAQWGIHFQGNPIREIPIHDGILLLNALKSPPNLVEEVSP